MFGFKKYGTPIAIFKNRRVYCGKETDEWGNSISNDTDDFKTGKESLQPILVQPDGRKCSIPLIAGPQGIGKSYLTASLVREYLDRNPDNSCWYFSATCIDDDPAYELIDRISQVITDPNDPNYVGNVMELDITFQDEKSYFKFGDIFVFDDCNTIRDETIRKQVINIMEQLLETGRKLGYNCIITSHLINPNDKKFGRILMNEMTDLIVFPDGGGMSQIRYALKKYFDFSDKQIDKLKESGSRWVWIHKLYPQYIMTEHRICKPL